MGPTGVSTVSTLRAFHSFLAAVTLCGPEDARSLRAKVAVTRHPGWELRRVQVPGVDPGVSGRAVGPS